MTDCSAAAASPESPAAYEKSRVRRRLADIG